MSYGNHKCQATIAEELGRNLYFAQLIYAVSPRCFSQVIVLRCIMQDYDRQLVVGNLDHIQLSTYLRMGTHGFTYLQILFFFPKFWGGGGAISWLFFSVISPVFFPNFLPHFSSKSYNEHLLAFKKNNFGRVTKNVTSKACLPQDNECCLYTTDQMKNGC